MGILIDLDPQTSVISNLNNVANQLGARGFGYCYLLSALVSGTIALKLRECLLQYFSNPDEWRRLCGWTKWTGHACPTDNTTRSALIGDMQDWIDVWSRIDQDIRIIIQSQEVKQDVTELMGKYAALAKANARQGIDSLLLQETELFGELFSNGIVLPWNVRVEVRQRLLVACYGLSAASMISTLAQCQDIFEWYGTYRRLDPTLAGSATLSSIPQGNKTLPVPGTDKPGPSGLAGAKSESSGSAEKEPSGSGGQGPSGKPAKTGSSGPLECYNCGEQHGLINCPSLPVNEVRRSARVAACFETKDYRKMAGLLGVRAPADSGHHTATDDRTTSGPTVVLPPKFGETNIWEIP